MKTKVLMITSSVALGLAGLVASFAPEDLLRALGSPPTAAVSVVIQLLGALYVAFAIMNWTAKDNIIGGIYSRPLLLGNCVHFVSGGLALAKQQVPHGMSLPLAVVLVVYAIFAVCFLWLIFGKGAAGKEAS